jgi:hypothetical protein
VAVLDRGRLIGLGSPSSLKDRYGPGAVIEAKVKDSSLGSADSLSSFISAELPEGSLLDVRLGQIKYAVPRDTEWSRLFAVMEKATRRFQLEDYTINACSLEDVFLLLSSKPSA